ncbi:hypothetical protein PtB15_9B14 [Puccinia triticina]|nr:hypothetical protein PtB15_9B14 [Puccinia triticina]
MSVDACRDHINGATIPHFLRDGIEHRAPSAVDLHILKGGKSARCLATWLQLRSEKGRNAYTVNGGKTNSMSIKRYISGRKAWHRFHSKAFSATRFDLMLKVSGDLKFEESLLTSDVSFSHTMHHWEASEH